VTGFFIDMLVSVIVEIQEFFLIFRLFLAESGRTRVTFAGWKNTP
jgi:hypothetical protein